jgi:hypothetical protein
VVGAEAVARGVDERARARDGHVAGVPGKITPSQPEGGGGSVANFYQIAYKFNGGG